MSDKTVPITMPDWMWGRLVTIAEFRKMDVGQLIAATLEAVIEADPDRFGELRAELHAARTGGFRIPHSSMAGRQALSDQDLARISELRDQGYSDAAIAKDMGLTRYKVQYHRSRAGIPAYVYSGKRKP